MGNTNNKFQQYENIPSFNEFYKLYIAKKVDNGSTVTVFEMNGEDSLFLECIKNNINVRIEYN